MRHLWLLVHRWAGLTIAAFLVIAALTGAVLPFEEELTLASRSDVAHPRPSRPGQPLLDGVAIARAVERRTGGEVRYVPLDVRPERVVRLFVTARPGRPALPYDTVWADPYTGEVKLAYSWGGVRDGVVDVVPFLYSLHYGYVAGPWGSWAFGVAGVVWTIDCFVGFYLTLPPRLPARSRRAVRRRSWWRQWSAAWRVRRTARGHRLRFDLHRASGLWLWPLLFAFAWSSVGLLLPSVERPVMRALGASDAYVPPPLGAPLVNPPMRAGQAVAAAERTLADIGRREGFATVRAAAISYDAASGTYRLDALTTLDHGSRRPATSLWIDARDGRTLHLSMPFGEGGADAVRRLFLGLHFADLMGLPYRLLVSCVGLATATLTVTGVLLWTLRRAARRKPAQRRL